jgi:hypothetical protein
MSKLIHHTWEKVVNTKKLKHKQCTRCECQQFYDEGFGQVMFQDRFGKIFYKRPKCVLPNILL